MDIAIEQAQARVPVTIMRVVGDIDASNYRALITRTEELFAQGTRDVLLDLSQVGFMSSAGLVAMQGIISVLAGASAPDPDSGWGALREIDSARESGMQPHLKLLSPQPAVDGALERVGFKDYIQVHTDQAAALNSF